MTEPAPEELGAEQAGRVLDGTGVRLDPHLRARILAEAAGDRLALEELAQPWRDDARPGADVFDRFLPITSRLRDEVLARLPGDVPAPPATTRSILVVAALLAGGDLHELLAAAARLTGHDVTVEDVDAGVRWGVLGIENGRIRFSTDLVRSVIVATAAPSEVRAADAVVARELTRLGEWQRGAWHAAHATGAPDEKIAQALVDSANEAEHHGDAVDALRRMERAARLTPDRPARARRFVRAGQKAYELGRPEVAEHLMTEAERLGLDLAEQGVVQALRYRFGVRLNREGAQIGARCRAVHALIDAGEYEAALDAVVGIAQSLAMTEPKPLLREAFQECLSRLAGSSDAGDLDQDPRFVGAFGVAAPERARQLALGAEVSGRDADGLRLLGTAAFKAGELPRAADLYAAAARDLRRSGRIGMLTHVLTLHAQVTVLLGDWDTAELDAGEALDLAGYTGQELWALRARAVRAMVRALRDDGAGALADCEHIEQVAASGQQLGPILALASLARAAHQLSRQQWPQACVTLLQLHDPAASHFDHDTAIRSLDYLAEAAVHADRLDDLAVVVARHLGPAHPGSADLGSADLASAESEPDPPDGAPPVLAIAISYARALLSPDESAEAAFDVALRAAGLQFPWLRARVELARGVWLRRQRRIVESRTDLESARRVFALLGAVSWAARAAAELRAAGVGHPDAGPGPADGDQQRGTTDHESLLSPQELTIARLAAQGLTNREIGQRLRLSPRTIGSHLYKIYPKLDITSRTQLAAALGTPPA